MHYSIWYIVADILYNNYGSEHRFNESRANAWIRIPIRDIDATKIKSKHRNVWIFRTDEPLDLEDGPAVMSCLECDFGNTKLECITCDGRGSINKRCRRCNGTGDLDCCMECPRCDGIGSRIKECRYCDEGFISYYLYGRQECGNCKGKWSKRVRCGKCDGTGDFEFYQDCGTCKGKGRWIKKCYDCDGKGECVCPCCDGKKYLYF